MKAISKTAFYCCGTRMIDSESSQPLCGDSYAGVFMNEEGQEIVSRFSKMKKPNASTVCRHRIIDDLLKAALAKTPDMTIVIIGAGFDSRAFRLKGGRWIEVDDEALILYKNRCLPASESNNPLTRIPGDILQKDLYDRLALLIKSTPVFFIMEGVTVYITKQDMTFITHQLQKISDDHTLICDLQNRSFYRWVSKSFENVLKTIDVSFSPPLDKPESLFFSVGYRLIHRLSIPEICVELGGYRIPKILLKTVFYKFKYAYSVWSFRYQKNIHT